MPATQHCWLSYSLPKSFFVISSIVFSLQLVHSHSKVLLVSFDAFRYDYYDIYQLTSLKKLADNGVHAKNGIIPTFATKTFPNHFTIVTGLYEENHGIIDNDMYDPEFKETFEMPNKSPKWWDGGEPIWNTAKMQGRKTAAAFWPGSDVEIRGLRPDFNVGYNRTVTFEMRVDQAVVWLTQKNVDFVALYFQEPDSTGHKHGILSPQMKEAINLVDATLNQLLNKLTAAKMIDKIDLIVLGDHGMVNTSNVPSDDSKVIYLDKYIDMTDVLIIPQTGTLAGIFPHPGKENKVYNDLKNAKIQHVSVYKKDDIPDKWHYKHHRRISPVVVFADEGWIIARNKTEINIYTIGQHGYDNGLLSMRPIFFAQGPSFKKKVTIEPFSNVNIYSLLCHLLDVTPAPNNGSLMVFKNILNASIKQQPLPIELTVALAGFLCFYVRLEMFL